MKKFFFLAALLCASVMAFAVAPVVGSSTENMDGQPGFTNGYDYSFSTEGTSVTISFTEKENYTGLVAYLWNYTNGFAETGMTVEGHTASITLTNQVAGSSLTFACKFAFAGGMSVTKQFTYVVPNDGGGEEPAAEPTEIYDTNFALASNGASATASSGTAADAIDGNTGTRWESAATDDETWTLNMGQLRIYNTIQIRWEGAYGKTFDIESSKDGESWKTVKQVVDQSLSGFPYEQTFELAENDTAQYIRFTGIARGTQYGYSFWEFRVLLPNVSVLTSINLTAANTIAQVGGAGVALTAIAKDQNNTTMEAEISYEITPADAGNVVNGKYIPAKVGNASIVAYNGEVRSEAVSIFGYEGNNLVLSTNIDTDNKVIAQSEYAPNGTNAFFAVDGKDDSVWQGSATNGTAGDETSRTYDAWFVVDLGGKYSIDLITIKFEGACSQDYHVDFSEDNTVWNLGYNYVGTAGINGRTDVLSAAMLDNNQKVRYVRFWSTKAGTQWGVKVFEFQVFGREYVPAGDTEKPEMTSAELVSKTWNSAVIAVAATDNNEVAKYHVVNTTPTIDVKLVADDGKITVTGLTAETAYNFTITALDASQNESDNSKSVAVTTEAHLLVPNVAAPAPTWDATLVKSLYSDAYDFAPASLNSYNEGWWDNPTMTEETIGDNHYLHYDLYRNGMIGVQFAEVSVATMENVHIDVFASEAGSVTFRLITAGDAEAINNTKKTLNLQAGQWNSFDFDLSEFGDHNWTRLFQYSIEGYQAGGLVGEHISVDNVYFYRTTEIQDKEDPTNVTASKVSESYFSVVLAASAEDNSGAVIYSVMNGETELATAGGASGATVNITVDGLTPNTEYTLSVIAKDEKDNAAEPVNVAVKTLAAPAAAPAPVLSGLEKVVPVFTDAQEGGPAIGIGGWGQSTKAQVVELAANDEAYYCTNFNYLGWELNPAVDATGTNYLHVDFYTTNLTKISVTPISPGKEGVKVIELTANEWNSVDIELSAYDGKEIVWSNIFQFKFFDAATAGGELFIDNVYFYKPTSTALDNAAETVKAQKVIENGQLIIIKNGIRYNVAGQLVK